MDYKCFSPLQDKQASIDLNDNDDDPRPRDSDPDNWLVPFFNTYCIPILSSERKLFEPA